MKNLIPFSLFALTAVSISSCASISNVSDDDVYVMKGSEIPIGESLDDETSYTAYKYKKDRNNNATRYQGNNSFVQPPFFMTMGYHNGFYGYNPYRYNPYGFYDPYAPLGHHGSHWGYMPGYGWTYIGGNSFYGYGGYYGYGNPYGYDYYGYPSYGYGNPYGYGYGYYGNPYGYGYGYPYGYGSGYYGNPYGNYYGNNGNGWGWGNNNSNSNPNHYSGARGTSSGGGVRTQNNRPGTVKMGTTTPVQPVMRPVTAAAGNRVSKPVGNDKITSRPSSAAPSADIRRPATTVNDGGSLSRPGRTQTTSPVNQGRANNPAGTVSNPGNSGGRTLNSGSTSPARTPSNVSSPSRTPSSTNQNTSPSRNTSSPSASPSRGTSSPSASPSRGGGSGGSGGGSAPSRPAGGGGRR